MNKLNCPNDDDDDDDDDNHVRKLSGVCETA